MDIAALIPVFIAFFVVAVSPGPANIAVATIAMSKGRQPAIRFGMGLGSGLAIWGVVAATGLGAVLQGSAFALTLLKLAGGVYLLWLAYKSWQSASVTLPDQQVEAGWDRWFLRGLILNLSNPKAVVAWMAALSLGMGQDGEWVSLASATVICIAIGFGNYAGHAFAFSVSGFMSAYAKARAWVESAVAVFFAAAGLGLIRSAFAR